MKIFLWPYKSPQRPEGMMKVPTVKEKPAANQESWPGLVTWNDCPMTWAGAIEIARQACVNSWANTTLATKATSLGRLKDGFLAAVGTREMVLVAFSRLAGSAEAVGALASWFREVSESMVEVLMLSLL